MGGGGGLVGVLGPAESPPPGFRTFFGSLVTRLFSDGGGFVWGPDPLQPTHPNHSRKAFLARLTSVLFLGRILALRADFRLGSPEEPPGTPLPNALTNYPSSRTVANHLPFT